MHEKSKPGTNIHDFKANKKIIGQILDIYNN